MTRTRGEDPYQIPIERLNLSMRGYNCLRRVGLVTVGHILQRTEEEILSVRNLGRKPYEELRERLDEMGILPLDADWDSNRV